MENCVLFRHTGHNPAIIFGQIQNSTLKRKYLDYFVGDYNFWESPPKITEVTETPDACCVQQPEEATVDTHVYRFTCYVTWCVTVQRQWCDFNPPMMSISFFL